MREYTTQCPECGGLGLVLDRAQLVSCGECAGTGRVEAVLHQDFIGDEHGKPRWAPMLIPVPKENLW